MDVNPAKNMRDFLVEHKIGEALFAFRYNGRGTGGC